MLDVDAMKLEGTSNDLEAREARQSAASRNRAAARARQLEQLKTKQELDSAQARAQTGAASTPKPRSRKKRDSVNVSIPLNQEHRDRLSWLQGKAASLVGRKLSQADVVMIALLCLERDICQESDGLSAVLRELNLLKESDIEKKAMERWLKQ